MIKFFSDITDDDLLIVGGKGMSLAKMTNADFPVPPGFVLTTEAFGENTLVRKDRVFAAFDKLNCQYVAVRSSGTKEDGLDDSFAGQFDTYLYVDRDHLIQKIEECHASLQSDRLQTYCESKGIDPRLIKVAVVVQKMINSEVAGVGFSVHPVTQDRNTIIIEGALGLGEAVVSGSVTPDSYLIDKNSRTIKEKYISIQNKQLLRGNDGGTEWIDIATERQTFQKLSDSHILLLADIIIRLETFYGLPVDTEWALEKDKLYMTQSRPITTLDKNSETQEKMTSLPDEIVSKLQNITDWYGKSYAGYLWGIFQQGFSITYASKNIPEAMPYGMFVINKSRECHREWFWDNALLIEKRNQLLEKNRKSTIFAHNYLQDYKRLFAEYLDKLSYFSLPSLLSFSNPELSPILQEIYSLYLPHAGKAYVADLFLSTDEKDWLEEKIEDSLGHHISDDIKSLLTAPTYESFVHEAELEKLRIAYIMKSGGEEKDYIDAYIQKRVWLKTNYREADPLDYKEIYQECFDLSCSFTTTKDIEQKLEEELHRIDKNKEQKKRLYKELHISQELQNVIEVSEIFTHIQDIRKQGVLRTNYFFFTILETIASDSGIEKKYMLSLLPEELRAFLEGKSIDWDYIKDRYEKGCACIFYGNTYEVLVGEEMNTHLTLDNLYPSLDTHHSLKGTVAFHGKIKGIVRILRNTTDIKNFQEGEILVANQTTPEFVPAMKKALGIITDQGGITAHAAIVARELKKPCIIGTKIATQVLQDGDNVEIDTYNGVVTILESSNLSIPSRLLAEDFELIASRPMCFQRDELLASCYADAIGIDRLSVSIDGNNRAFYSSRQQIDTRYNKFIQDVFNDIYGWQKHKEGYQSMKNSLSLISKSYEELSCYSENQLRDYFQEWNQRLQYINGPYCVAPFVIERMIDPMVRKLLSDNYGQELANNYFSIASSPTDYIEYQRMRIDICKMKILGDYSQLDLLVQRYKRYSEYTFTEKLLNEDYFLDQLSKISLEEAQQELQDIITTVEDHKQHYIRIQQEISDPIILHRLDIINTYVYLRTDRVDVIKQGQIHIRNFYKVIAEKLYNNSSEERIYEDVLLLSNEEIINFLVMGSLPQRQNIIKRLPDQYYFFYDYQAKKKYVVTNQEALQKVKSLLNPIIDNQEISGMIAYPGKVKGRVKKIYSREDIVKIEDGDILVARHTMIDYTPAMKIAGAFVTDEGGITSHTAIVARELKKPCLLGCKVAMKQLEDNDLIEVDANNGKVILLEKVNKDLYNGDAVKNLLNIVDPIQRDVQKFNAYPFFISSVATSSGFQLPRELHYNHFFCISHNHTVHWHYDIADYEHIGNIFWKHIQTPTQLKELIEEYNILYNIAKSNTDKERKISDDSYNYEGNKLLNLIAEEMKRAAGYGHLIEAASYIGEQRLIKDYGKEYIIQATSPSFLREAQHYASLLIKEYGSNEKSYHMFMEKYKRIKNTYLGITAISFEEMIELSNHDSIYENINYTDDFLQLLSLLFSRQDQRKAHILQSIHRGDTILKRIAQEKDYDLESLYFMLPEELSKFGNSYYHEELKKRKEIFVDYAPVIGERIKLIGSQAKEFVDSYTIHIKENSILKGNTAYPGKVIGRARICLSLQSIKNFQEGEILVASMTRPEYIGAMKKALAFVTDEGGITCHASIVARELKKPCIIGLRKATRILQDGDLIEVDADRGEVRVLEKFNNNLSYFMDMDISYEGGRACYKIMNYLLNMGYTLPNSFIEMPSSLGLISYIVGPHVKRYRYIDDVTKYNLYLEKILQGMNILEDTYKSITSLSSETRSFLNTSISSGLSKLSSEDLIKLYNTYLKRYTQMVFSSFVLRMIDRGIILYVTKHWEYNQDGILAHMSAMTTYSHALQEERDIADIAQLLLTDTYDSEDSMIQEKIQSLVENYAWIGLGYYNEPIKKLEDYKEILKGDLLLLVNTYATKKESFENILQERSKWLEEQSPEVQKVAHIASEAVRLKDYYKFSINKMQYDAEPLWSEISVRTGKEIPELKDLLPEEIISLLSGNSINFYLVEERNKACIMYNQQEHIHVLVGNKAIEFAATFLENQSLLVGNSWKGRIACRGIVSGPARIILSPDDFSKVEPGDILVVTNTSPDFVVLFDRIVGIVAEEGGITAHVSVVSREYGIPCLVGIHGITKELQDGQMFTLDAESGILFLQ